MNNTPYIKVHYYGGLGLLYNFSLRISRLSVGFGNFHKSDIISSMEQKIKFLSGSSTAAAALAMRAAQILGLLYGILPPVTA